MQRRLMIAAPASGSGKTVMTLALLRALRDSGLSIAAAKAGPDYIDPAFHEAACGQASVNLDPWAMPPGRLLELAVGQGGSHLLVEAMMGLFDGAADGSGSAADLAVALDMPVLLVLDAAKQSHSIAALAEGFVRHRPEVKVAAVLLNRVGSARHERLLRDALVPLGLPVAGAVPRDPRLHLPERHLGLVQAGENAALETFIAMAAGVVGDHIDLDLVTGVFGAGNDTRSRGRRPVPPLGQRIAIAKDTAFSFLYPHLAADWHALGAELHFFSPLGDESPAEDADAVYLPGGYPELNGGKLAAADHFRAGLRKAAARGALVYGECGGYMVLGEGLVDAGGNRHVMAGLLPLETSFEKRKLHLGYRQIAPRSAFVLGERLRGHEFHYTTAIREEGEPLFDTWDATGEPLGQAGLRKGRVMGSYLHVIDAGAANG